MPADPSEKSASPPAAASPPSAPDKPRTAEQRKSSKPVMEKRRRARINDSLAQLKTLILDALRKDSSRHSKLEKADILEMTVKHLRGLQRAQMPAALNTDPAVLGKYRAGFGECVNEVTRFLSACEGVSPEVRGRLLGHLAGCMSQISALNYAPPAPPPPAAQHGASFLGQALAHLPASSAAPAGSPGAGESTKVYGGFQLVPTSDGHFAFLIPGTAFAPPGNAVLPLYASGGRSSGLPPAAVSPGPAAADSVWRPW